ncbi:MAG: TRAP transporter large permease [Desulfobulbaceae bacterium]|nr:TRAP transporter large permease [Desulfobulbaceae bacterium]
MIAQLMIVFVIMIVIMMLEVPIFYAFGLGTFILIILNDIDPAWAFSGAFDMLQSFVFLCLPLYILLGILVDGSGVAKKLCDWFISLVGRFRGGLGVAVVLTNALFGAISGASLSALAGIGSALLPSMEKEGYPKAYSIALLIPSATLSLLIPPSAGMIIFGFMGKVPITYCFLAPLLPGVIMTLLLITVHLVMCRKIDTIKVSEKTTIKTQMKEISTTTKKAGWGLGIPVICLGGIYAGIYTPTEAAATTTVYTILIGFLCYRTLTVRKFKNHLLSAASVTSSIVILIFIFSALSKVLIIAQVSEAMLELMLAISTNYIVQLCVLNLILFLMGMIMDDSSAIMVSAIVLLPVAKSLGIDPYHFAAMTGVNLAMGIITPPVAALLYLGGHIADLPVNQYIKPVMIYILFAMFPTLLLTMFVPSLSTFLPYWLMGR